MNHIRPTALTIVLACSVATTSGVVVADPPGKAARPLEPGDLAVVVQSTKLHRDNQPVGVIDGGSVVEVGGVRGLRLSIRKPHRGEISALNALPLAAAEGFFSDRLLRNPNDVATYVMRGQMHVYSRDYKRAIADFKKAIELQPGDGQLDFQVGMTWLEVERLGLARVHLETAATRVRDKRNGAPAEKRARFLTAKANVALLLARDLSTGNYQVPKYAFMAALQADENDVPARLGLGEVHLANNRWGPALVEIDKAIELDPDNARAHALRGKALIDKDELDAALAALDRALELDEESIEAWLLRARAHLYRFEREAADADFDRAGLIEPRSLRERLRRAEVFNEVQRFDEALQDLDVVIQRSPKSLKGRTLRARAKLGLERYDEAITEYVEAFRSYRSLVDEARLHSLRKTNRGRSIAQRMLLVRIYLQKRDFAKALEIWEQIKRVSEHPMAVGLTRSRIAAAQENFAEALETANQVVEQLSQYQGKIEKIDEYKIDALVHRAMVKEKLGDYAGLLADLQAGQAIDRNSAVVNNNLAWLRATCPLDELRDGTAAVEYATKACEARLFRDAGSIDTLAAAYAEAGDFAQAVQWQQRAVGLAFGEDQARMSERVALYREQRPYREDNRVEMGDDSDGGVSAAAVPTEGLPTDAVPTDGDEE
ncbi:MAG: tetratricopeptide repeat protein [Planctomycetota bacterium]|nr:MAG: tetratricopeptide repeat protein [Planctomycetota bacterium]